MAQGRKRKKAVGYIRKALQAGTPVNKGSADGQGNTGGKWLPQIDHPLIVGALGAAGVGVGAVIGALKDSRRHGRAGRFEQEIITALASRQLPDDVELRVANVELHEGFGKPSLAVIDVMASPVNKLGAYDRKSLLEVIYRAAWDNTVIAPLTVCARVLDAADGNVITQAEDLGFECDTVTPGELYAYFGAPRSDPKWTP